MSNIPTTAAAEGSDTTAASSYEGHGHRHLGLALALISAAQLMVVLDATIVNIAMPFIRTELNFSDANLSWVINSYTLAFGGLLLIGGRAGDLFGRRKVFIFGVVLFAVASLLGGLATGQTTLILARILQGVGAAIASPTALSLITTTFPPGPPRNRAFAVYAAMSGAGAAVGLILGGALTEIDWRWTFFINVPIGLGVALLAPRFLGESEPQRGIGIDIPGAVTGTAGLVALVYGLTNAGKVGVGWSSASTIAWLTSGVLLLTLFAVIEAKVKHPMLPLRILADRSRAVTYFTMLAVGSAIFAMFFFLGLYIQEVLGYSPLKAGFAFLPFSFGVVFSAQAASYLASRVDTRYLACFGALLAGAGLFWNAQLEVGSSYWPSVLGPMMLISFGMGFLFVPLTLTAIHRIAHQDTGIASGVLNTTQQVGGALGLATLATVAASAISTKATQLGAAAQDAAMRAVAAGGPPPTPEQLAAMREAITDEAQTYGYTRAFLVATGIVIVGALVVLLGLNVKHDELSTDGDMPGMGH